MKVCPVCNRTYPDSLKFCRSEGTELINGSESETVKLPVAEGSKSITTSQLSTVPSIAVLPFVNLSADEANDYFCDGLAEELINALAKTGELKVAARTSAFSFRDQKVTIQDIGRALSVGAVLEGSVRKAGKQIRITVQLVNSADGYHLWSERYDRYMEDVFAVQDEITMAIVAALQVRLLGDERAAILRHHTVNTEAYELFLKGRYYHNKFTPENWNKAIDYFDQALALEPEYALAYAWKALSLEALSYFGVLAAETILPKWEETANRAVELDPNLAEAHLSLAQHRFYHDWKWKEAEEEFKKSIELSPNNVDAQQYYGLFLATRDRAEEAIKHGKRALDLDPLSLLTIMQVGWTYMAAGRPDGAALMVNKMIEIEPNFYGAHWMMGAINLSKGLYGEAIEALERSLSLSPNLLALSQLGTAYAIAGRSEDARNILNQLMEIRAQRSVAAYNVARVHSGLSDNDRAFEWLNKAFAERNGEMVFLRGELNNGTGDTFGKSIRDDPRLAELLHRIEDS